MDEGNTSLANSITTQYNKLAEDWRQFNNILWGIPTIAVSIMAGIIVVAYQPDLTGWPRFVSLAVGALFLFALTIEVVRKRLHMNIISDISKQLQGEYGLDLNEDFQFPLGINKDVEKYWIEKHTRIEKKEQQIRPRNTTKETKEEPKEDCLFNLLKGISARGFLTLVTFLAAISIAVLAALDLVHIIVNQIHFMLPFELP